MNISIVIPTYNESENIPILFENIFSVLEQNQIKGEIIVVDDNSQDGTDKVVRTVKINKSIYPSVVITRADGEVIAEDDSGIFGYTWRVPDDLKINGDEEELTVTVTYDTQKLYGEVSAQRKIKIRK